MIESPTEKDIVLIASIPAMLVNKVYVTITGGIGRLTFVDAVSAEIAVPRVATAMSLEVLADLRDSITECMRIEEQRQATQQQAMVEAHGRFN